MDIVSNLSLELKKSNYVVAFSGESISAESGIPIYRGKGGLSRKYDPNLYDSLDYFFENTSYYWKFFWEIRYPLLNRVKPKRAHLALVELENNSPGLRVCLRQKAIISSHGGNYER